MGNSKSYRQLECQPSLLTLAAHWHWGGQLSLPPGVLVACCGEYHPSRRIAIRSLPILSLLLLFSPTFLLTILMPCSLTCLPSDDLSFWNTKQRLSGFCEQLP